MISEPACLLRAVQASSSTANSVYESQSVRREGWLLSSSVYLVLLLSLLLLATSASACKLTRHDYVLDEVDCDLMQIVRLNRCSGSCRSFSFLDLEGRRFVARAKCCRMIDYTTEKVNVTCGGVEKTFTLRSATSCECTDCSRE